MVYALLDDKSDACFVKQTALEKLGVDGPEIHLKLSTVLAQETITSQKITGLVVHGVDEYRNLPSSNLHPRYHSSQGESDPQTRNSAKVASP